MDRGEAKDKLRPYSSKTMLPGDPSRWKLKSQSGKDGDEVTLQLN